MKNFNAILILSLLFYCSILSAQTERIKNGGFENSTSNIPDDFSKLNESEAWTDDEGPNNGHSPDWVKPCNGGFTISERLNGCVFGDLIPIEGNTECAYAGVVGAELFEQKLDLSPGAYKLSFFFRLVECGEAIPSNGDPVGELSSGESQGSIVVSIARNKIKYVNQEPISPYVMSGGQNIREILNVPLSFNQFPTGEWHQVEQTFVIEDNGINFEWIGFDFGGGAYLLFDDISLEYFPCDMCTNILCNPYTGCIDKNNLVFANSHGQDNNQGLFSHWGIKNLENVKNLRVKLWNEIGQPVRDITVPYVGHSFIWDGKNESGAEITPQAMSYAITVTNECGTTEKTGGFVKSNSSADPTPDWSDILEINASDILTPNFANYDVCCEETLKIKVSDFPDGIISGDLNINGPAIVDIEPGITVASGSTINIIAGQEITMLSEDELIIETGAVVNMMIEECMMALVQPINNTNQKVEESLSEKIQPSIKEIESISIFPNPTFERSFNIKIDNANSEKYDISVFEVLSGKLVFAKNGNIGSTKVYSNNFKSGIYIVEIKTVNQSFVEKLVFSLN